VAGSLFGRPRAEVEAALPDREAVVCPLCGRAPRQFGIDFQGLHLARCGACGLEFQHPRPVFAQLAAAVYAREYHPEGHQTVDGSRERTFARQMERLERCVRRRPAALLDVGCGAGAFLGYARARGWTVGGTDISLTDDARRHGSRLWEGQLPDIDFHDARFDAVRLNHVLEHTQDPLRELRCARRIVADDGVLLIGVPNIAGLSIRLKSWQSRLGLKRRRWKHYGALHHLWFFSPATLAAVVEAAGFSVARWETPAGERPGRSEWMRSLVKGPLEAVRMGGILDLYARPRPRSPHGSESGLLAVNP
jgi:2-polyprenyl-3-methyl-5-hydroxy-6-metoxy-1,4-benzoquinol methylase